MFFRKKALGIDIGTASIKVVELSSRGKTRKLENYGELNQSLIQEEGEASNVMVAEAIKAILKEAKIPTKTAIFSIPDFFTFCTSFEIPQMTPDEIPGAIQYNAAQYITLPVSEVTLDWQVMPTTSDNKGPLKVFLVAVPNKIVKSYQMTAKLAGLDLYALEPEAFSIARALTKYGLSGSDKKTVCILDMGVKTSTINLVSNGYLRVSYSFSLKSEAVVSSAVSPAADHNGLAVVLEPVCTEVKNMFADFLQKEKKEVEVIYLTGGIAGLPGVKEFFKENLGKEVVVPNSFEGALYSSDLNRVILEMSPRFSAAVGVALFGLEN